MKSSSILKYGAGALCCGLWLFGLSDQIHSLEMTVRYVALSGALVAVAFL